MAEGKYKKWLEPDNLLLIQGWARDGLTDAQIAHNMGISRSTLNVWMKNFPCISDTLKKGKEVVDLEVENSLLKRALGYKYTEKKTKTEMGVVTEITETTKEVVPDVTAQIFWLKNRKPEKWRDKQVIETNSNGILENLINELKADGVHKETT